MIEHLHGKCRDCGHDRRLYTVTVPAPGLVIGDVVKLVCYECLHRKSNKQAKK